MNDWQDPETPIYNQLMRQREITPSATPIYDQLLAEYQAQGKLQEEEQMNKMQTSVEEFREAAGQTVNEAPRIPSVEDMSKSVEMIDYAVKNLTSAVQEQNILGVAEFLAVLLYDTFGTAAAFGIDMQPIFDEVHKSMLTSLKPGEYMGPQIGVELNKQTTYGHEDLTVYKTKEIPITLGIGGPKIGTGNIYMEHNGDVMMQGVMDDVSTLPVIDHLGFTVSGLSIGDDIPASFPEPEVVQVESRSVADDVIMAPPYDR